MKQQSSQTSEQKHSRAWAGSPYSPQAFAARSLQDQLEHLCLLGHLAPSTHNSQPWRFQIDASRRIITLSLDRQAILPASDPAGRQAVISIGCALKNMMLGAQELGMPTSITYLSNDVARIAAASERDRMGQYIPLARLRLGLPAPPASPPSLYPSIFSRKVVRAEFDPERLIPAEIMKEMNDIGHQRDAATLLTITEPQQRLTVAELQAQADSFVLNSKTFSEELGMWLLPNNTTSSVGMPGIGFGLQDAQAVRIHEGLLNKRPLEPEDSLRFALAGRLGMEKSPLIGCVATREDSIRNWLDAGILLEHVLLALDRQGIAVALHAGIAEVALVRRMFMATFRMREYPAILFRAGFVRDPAVLMRPHSPRLPLDEVLLDTATVSQ